MIEFDDYIFDTLMRDLIEHECSSSAFLVYIYIWAKTMGEKSSRRIPVSYQTLQMVPDYRRAALNTPLGC